MRTLLAPLSIVAVLLLASDAARASVILGTGTGALIGRDLTDPENDGQPDADVGYNAVFTSNDEPGFGGGEYSFNVFDNRVGGGNDKWCCGPGGGIPVSDGLWITAHLNAGAHRLTHFTVTSGNDTPGRDPTWWAVQGSNDGVSFTTIFERPDSPAVWTARNQVIRFDSSEFGGPGVRTAYEYFRFVTYDTTYNPAGAYYQLNEIEYFGVAVDQTLTAAANGEWNQAATWGSPPGFVPPTASTDVIVNGPTVNVGGPGRLGGNVWLDSGTISVDAGADLTVTHDLIAAAGSTLAVSGRLSVGGSLSAQTLAFGNGATLEVGDGLVVAVTTSGNSNVTVNGGLLGVGAWHDQFIPGTLTKQGAGILGMDNSGGFSNLSATAIHVAEGEVYLRGSNPLAGANSVTLSGGRLTLEPGVLPTGAANDLRERYYSGDAAAYIDPLAPGQGYLAQTPINDDSYSNGSARMTAAGRHTYLDLDQPDDWNIRSNYMVPAGDPNNFGAVWSGALFVGAPGSGAPIEAGEITLATASDDGSTWWVDGQLIVNNNYYQGRTERSGTVVLGPGYHEIFIGWYEGGGGANMEAKIGQGAGLAYNDPAMMFVDPGNPAQAGMWNSEATVAPYDVSGLTVTVDAPGSGLNLVSRGAVTLGTLNLHNTGEVTIQGAAGGVNITSTNVAAAGPTSVRLNAAVPVNPGVVNMNSGPGSPVTLSIGGPETVTLTQTALNTSNATFEVEAGGTLQSTTITPLGGAALVLDGGTYRVFGTETVTPNNLLAKRYNYASEAALNDIQSTLLAQAPDGQTLTAARLNYNDDGQFNGLIPGPNDNYMFLFTGKFTPATTGTYNFRRDWNDDRGVFYVDINQDGIFQTSEKFGNAAWGGQAQSFTLQAGQDYGVAIGHLEWGGGSRMDTYYTPAGFGEQQLIPGIATGGTWSAVQYDPINATALDILVTAAGSGLQAISDGQADFGHLTLNDGTSLTTSGAPMTFASITIPGGANRTATLANNNNVSFNTYNDGGVGPATFRKSGTGTLTVDNSAAGIQAAATTWEVNQGTMVTGGADPLGGSTSVTLSGGTLDVTAEGVVVDGFRARRYNYADEGALNDIQGTLLARTPDGQAMSTGPLNFNDDGQFNALIPGGNDNYMFLFTAEFEATAGTGNYNFRRDWNDDRGVFYVDINQDGIFQTTEKFGNAEWNGQNQSFWLTGGEKYGVAVGHLEWGGGSRMDTFYTPNAGGEVRIDPSAQPGVWKALEYQAIDFSAVAMRVTADSGLRMNSDHTATVGSVTFENGAVLTTSGVPTTFNVAAIAGGAGRSGGINNSNEVTIAAYDDGGTTSTFVKRGGGTMTVDNAAAPGSIASAATNWRVEGGLLLAPGADPLGSTGSTVTLAGGNFRLDSTTMVTATLHDSFGQSWLHSTDVGGNLDGIGAGAGNGGLISATPEGSNFLTGPLNYHEGTFSTAAGIPGFNEDNIKFLWRGTLDVTTAGTYRFGVGNMNGQVPSAYGLDDDVVYYVDLNGDHVFQDSAGEKLWRRGCCTGGGDAMGTGVALGVGTYDIAIGFSNGGGGRYIGAVFSSDDGANWSLINPSDPSQAGMWSFTGQVRGPIDQPDVNIGVDGAGGTLTLNTDLGAALGNLNFQSGTLTIAGAPGGVTFTGGSVAPGASTYTLNNPMPVTISTPLDGGDNLATFNKTGAGSLTLAQGTTNHGGVSVNAKEGTIVSGADAQAANLVINGSSTVDTGSHNVAISENGTYAFGNWTKTISGTGAAVPFQVGGTDLATAPDRLIVQGGTVTVGGTAAISNTGLMGKWTFDGGNADDSSGNGYNGAASAGAIFSSDHPAGLGPRSLDLTAGNEYVSVADGGAFNLDQMSVSVWVKGWPSGGGWEPFVSKGGEAGQGWQLRRYGGSTSGEISSTLRGPGNDDFHTGATSANDGDWHNIVSTYGDGWRRIYVDGVLVAEEARSGGVNNTNSQLMFGARDASGWGGGFEAFAQVKLDDIYIYNRALNAADVAALHQNVSTRPAVNLPDTEVAVTGDATLFSDTPSTATYGNLALSPGVSLTLTGAPGGVSFNDVSGNAAVQVVDPIAMTVRGVLSPGNSVGKLAINGSLTMPAAVSPGDPLPPPAAYRWELGNNGDANWLVPGEDYDVVDFTGPNDTLTLNPTWELNLEDLGGEAAAGDKLYLFTGFENLSGTQSGLARTDYGVYSLSEFNATLGDFPTPWLEFTPNPTSSLYFGLDAVGLYLGGLQSVPEPSTFLLAALGLLGLGWCGRRRRKAACR